jgi:hypothetical protein
MNLQPHSEPIRRGTQDTQRGAVQRSLPNQEEVELEAQPRPQRTEDPWTLIQAIFVDDPQRAVDEACKLLRWRLTQYTQQLDAVVQRATEASPGNATTEDLRMTLQRLRSTAQELECTRF